MRGDAGMIAAVLPMGPKDAIWLSAKINSCRETLGPQMVGAVLVYAPSAHQTALRAALPSNSLPAHWHLLAEEEVVPAVVRNSPAWRSPWTRQQMIKLLAPRHHTAWPASARYVLALDSDTLCTHGWHGVMPRAVDTNGARRTSDLLETFVQRDGRIRGCVQPLSSWYGDRQLRRTATYWGAKYERLARSMGYAMGWTPQILSVDALDEVHAALLALPAARQLALADGGSGGTPFTRVAALLSRSRNWTEYATYELLLRSRHRWTAHHEDLSACAMSDEDASSSTWTWWHKLLGGSHAIEGGMDVSSGRCARQRPSRVHWTARASEGCLHVRVDCAEELRAELRGALVPFVLVNDHTLNAKRAARLVALETASPPNVTLRDAVRRRSLSVASHSVASHTVASHRSGVSTRASSRGRPMSAWESVTSWLADHGAPWSPHVDLELDRRPPEFRVDAYVLQLFARKRGRTFVELGANNGVNSHTRHLEDQLGWRGTCIEASPPNFAKLARKRPLCDNRHAVVWPFRTNVTFRYFPQHSKYYGHAGLVATRTPQEWARLLGSKGQTQYTDAIVAASPIAELVPARVDWFVLDVEGAELAVLQHFPWSGVRIRVWTIESNKLDRASLRQLMAAHGYACHDFDNINTVCTDCAQALTSRTRGVCA